MKSTLAIINNDGESFAQRAEMYYRERPEILNFVEEAFRAYRALAERYDHLSKELQSANRTIATVFPERAQYAMDDEEEENLTGTSTSSDDPNELDNDIAAVPKPSIPRVPKIPNKDFRSQSMLISRKKLLKRTATSSKVATIPSSGLSKTEAAVEIEKLQKEILALQTEKEFVQSSYNRGREKYWEIEQQITQIQERVCCLQDEFGIGTVIEDDEARTLMAATALKSCQKTLVQLQENQEQSTEEPRVERKRIEEAHKKFGALKYDLKLPKQTDRLQSTRSEFRNIDQEITGEGQEIHDMESQGSNPNEQRDLNSKASVTVMELAEKIDELVNKAVTLETSFSSQTALVKRLRSETDELQALVRSLEVDKESLVESSEVMSRKLIELEEDLRRVKNLNKNAHQNNNFQTHFTETSGDLDHLSVKLECVKRDEEVEDTGLCREVKVVPAAEPEKNTDEISDKRDPNHDLATSKDVMAKREENKDVDVRALSKSARVEEENQPDLSNDLSSTHENPREPMLQERDEKEESFETVDGDLDVEKEDEEERPIWSKMFVKGIEDREEILLEEYTSVLHYYKLVRKKLSKMEKNNRDGAFELETQIRELKTAVASKDEMIQSLLQKLRCPQESSFTTPEYIYGQQESIHIQAATFQSSDSTSSNMEQKSISDLFGEQHVESTEIIEESSADLNLEMSLAKGENQAVKHRSVLAIEEKFRSDINELLEENLEFWLRFSTSVHQIQKFQSSIQDLHAELVQLKDKKQEGSGKHQSLQSDIRPIYRHLREIQTELSLWMEHNSVLRDELQSRSSSLSNIQDEISRMSNADSRAENTVLSEYQAAKFQGEVLNMKQENNKVSDELQAGLNRVIELKSNVEKTLVRLDEEFGISGSKKQSVTRARIPLRSFLFGVKVKKQKPSIIPCGNPALQKQYSDLAA